MRVLFRSLYAIFLVLFFSTFALALSRFLPEKKNTLMPERAELYDEELNTLKSIEDLTNYWDKKTAEENVKPGTRRHVDMAFDIIKKRFYHGLARYDMRSNYIAYFADQYVWDHYSGIVIPDDILKHSEALCSQQIIVFLELLKAGGYKTREVRLNSHFCAEVFYEGSWHFYDTDWEIEFSGDETIPSTAELINNKDLLYELYEGKLRKNVVDRVFSEIKPGEVNVFPAGKMAIFHEVTKFLSNWIWLLFLSLAIYFRKRSYVKMG